MQTITTPTATLDITRKRFLAASDKNEVVAVAFDWTSESIKIPSTVSALDVIQSCIFGASVDVGEDGSIKVIE